MSKNAPPFNPILTDFGKSRLMASPKVYHLTDEEKALYRKNHSHLAPELIDGLAAQSPKSDIYSCRRIIHKVAVLLDWKALKEVALKCMVVNPDCRPRSINVYCLLSALIPVHVYTLACILTNFVTTEGM